MNVERFDDVDERDSADDWLDAVLAGHHPTGSTPPPLPTPMQAAASTGLRQLLDQAAPASPGLLDLVANSIAPATRAAYERDWADFELWARVHGVDDVLDEATPLLVGEYINELVRDRKAVSTIRRRLAALRWAFTLTGRPSPTGDLLVTTALTGARRLLGDARVQAAPLRLEELRRIVTGLPIVAPNRPTMRRDQTMLAVGWAGALRSAELVGLDVGDVHPVGSADTGDGGVVLALRDTKTSAGGVQYVAIPYSQQYATCPARRLLAWMRPLRTGPLFRHVDRHGHAKARLAPRSVTALVRQAITDCLQVDAQPYTSHSLRAGFVTEARARGVPDELIARHTRHARPGSRAAGILGVYDRPTDMFERPALDGQWW